jgi:hypothetical protein
MISTLRVERDGIADLGRELARDRSSISVGSARAGLVGLDDSDFASVGAKAQRYRQANDAASYNSDVRRNPAHLSRVRSSKVENRPTRCTLKLGTAAA